MKEENKEAVGARDVKEPQVINKIQNKRHNKNAKSQNKAEKRTTFNSFKLNTNLFMFLLIILVIFIIGSIFIYMIPHLSFI